MVAYVIAKCRECGHPLISHGARRQGQTPERICSGCEEHGGPCAEHLDKRSQSGD